MPLHNCDLREELNRGSVEKNLPEKNFWLGLPKGFFALAPMEEVTDTVFREVILRTSAPDQLHLVFSEFINVDGFLDKQGRDQVVHRLYSSYREQAFLREKKVGLVLQIWGSDPEKFYRAAREISDSFVFDGFDINMGCPVKKIIRKNACSALINHPELAKELIHATREGGKVPVSVKTRIGFNSVVTETWIESLLKAVPSNITVHGRTQKMQSQGEADWNEIRKAVLVRDQASPQCLITGNADIESYSDGIERGRSSGVDGLMIGRGIFRDPFFFSNSGMAVEKRKLELLLYHLQRFQEEWEGRKNFAILKRFFKIYVSSFESAGSLRAKLMEATQVEQAKEIVLGALSRMPETGEVLDFPRTADKEWANNQAND